MDSAAILNTDHWDVKAIDPIILQFAHSSAILRTRKVGRAFSCVAIQGINRVSNIPVRKKQARLEVMQRSRPVCRV